MTLQKIEDYSIKSHRNEYRQKVYHLKFKDKKFDIDYQSGDDHALFKAGPLLAFFCFGTQPTTHFGASTFNTELEPVDGVYYSGFGVFHQSHESVTIVFENLLGEDIDFEDENGDTIWPHAPLRDKFEEASMEFAKRKLLA